MKKVIIASLVSVVAISLPVTSLYAVESSANVALTSNYVFRGLSYSNDGIAIQGGYDIKQSKADKGWYAGVFASTVGDVGSDGFELDVTGGWKGTFSNQKSMGYDVGAIAYKFTDSNYDVLDTTEIFAGISYETAYAKLFLGSPANGDSYNYLDLGASFVVMKDMDLNLHYGHLSKPNINDLSASLGTKVKGFDLSLALTYQDYTSDKKLKFFATVAKKFDL